MSFKSLNPPPPFFSAPQEEKEEFFWYWIGTLRGSVSDTVGFVNHVFREAKSYQLTQLSFEDFKNKVLKELLVREDRYARYRRYSLNQGWYERHSADFRQKLGFQRQSHHTKKELSPEAQSQAQWREFTGLYKDKAKRYGRYRSRWYRGYNRSRNKFNKKEDF